MSDLVGKTIAGRYRVIQFLGRGGMADVYKVWDTQRAATLAVKVLHEDLAEDHVFLRRFRREAQTLAKLKHPNIVGFYELEQDGELIFMLMEYVDGITLSKASNRLGKPLTPAQMLGVLQPICSALHFAHKVGLIHCDIKPANIMIDQTGRVLLTDFGIARVTEGATTATMVGAGTPAYMSPEQVAGADPSPQTDIYSLGVVMYYLVTGGERPFTGERATVTGTIAEKIRWEQRNLAPPSPRISNRNISPELEAVILCCLAKDPKERYSSITELLDDLHRAIKAQPEALPQSLLTREVKSTDDTLSSVVYIPPHPTRSRRIYWIAGGAVVVIGSLFALLAGGVLILGSKNNITAPTAVVVTHIVEVNVTSAIPTNEPPAATDIPPTDTPVPTPVPSLSVTKDGSYLLVKGGPNKYDKRYGPVANGIYIVSENEKFGAYVDVLGNVYIIPFEKSDLQFLKKLNRKDFTALVKGDQPNWKLDLYTDDNGTYTLLIDELSYNQDTSIQISRSFTQ